MSPGPCRRRASPRPHPRSRGPASHTKGRAVGSDRAPQPRRRDDPTTHDPRAAGRITVPSIENLRLIGLNRNNQTCDLKRWGGFYRFSRSGLAQKAQRHSAGTRIRSRSPGARTSRQPASVRQGRRRDLGRHFGRPHDLARRRDSGSAEFPTIVRAMAGPDPGRAGARELDVGEPELALEVDDLAGVGPLEEMAGELDAGIRRRTGRGPRGTVDHESRQR